jgi:hypothetical protein
MGNASASGGAEVRAAQQHHRPSRREAGCAPAQATQNLNRLNRTIARRANFDNKKVIPPDSGSLSLQQKFGGKFARGTDPHAPGAAPDTAAPARPPGPVQRPPRSGTSPAAAAAHRRRRVSTPYQHIMPTKYGPKKPSTSYFMFMASTRAKVKEANPEATTTQLSQLLGSQWRGLTPEEKAVFEKQAADDKIRYKREHEKWTVEHPEEVAMAKAALDEKKRGTKRSKEEGAPKRALTAYIFFTNAVRAETKKEAPDAKVCLQGVCGGGEEGSKGSKAFVRLPYPSPFAHPVASASAPCRPAVTVSVPLICSTPPDHGLEQADGREVEGTDGRG